MTNEESLISTAWNALKGNLKNTKFFIEETDLNPRKVLYLCRTGDYVVHSNAPLSLLSLNESGATQICTVQEFIAYDELMRKKNRAVPAGAKAGCLGEFTVTVSHVCPECWHNGWKQDCEICGGKSDEETNCYDVEHDIPWTTQKDIWKAINAYDKYVELIAKQQEQIKMLREAIDNALRIKDLWQFANVGENYYEEQDLLNGMKSSLEQALSATERNDEQGNS